MTIKDVAQQLHGLSVDKCFNGKRYSRTRLESILREKMRNRDRYPVQIMLRDGMWFAFVNRYAERRDGYDYTIPENREKEKMLLTLL